METANSTKIYYLFTGEPDEIIPRNATHIYFHKSLRSVPAFAFYEHPHITSVHCHAAIDKIGSHAFTKCPRLQHVVMLGVRSVEDCAFHSCTAITCMECWQLERIGAWAFNGCKALQYVDLPAIRVVEEAAFNDCRAMRWAKFGMQLEVVRWAALNYCRSLESITIPLKSSLIAADNIFQGCGNLKKIEFCEQHVLDETIDALQVEEWKCDVRKEIESINQILLPNAPSYSAGECTGFANVGGLVQSIRGWIARVLRKIIRYKALHGRLLNEAVAVLLPVDKLLEDNVMNNVLPFLALPLHVFEGEEDYEEEDEGRKRRRMMLMMH